MNFSKLLLTGILTIDVTFRRRGHGVVKFLESQEFFKKQLEQFIILFDFLTS